MAKKSKASSTSSTDRRAIVEQMRKDQQRKERRTSLGIVGAAVLVAVALVGFAVVQVVQQDKSNARPLDGIGVASDAAGCLPVRTKKPEGQQVSGSDGNHVAVDSKVDYPDAPPAFGQHWPNFLQGAEIRSFFDTADRPPVERLVHSLEHGYTILWYDQTVADDPSQLDDVKAIAAKFPDPGALDEHFIAAPWTSEDGASFPKGTHLALTHWSVGGEGGDPSTDQVGVWEYCGKVSGTVVGDFTEKYPPTDAPEAGGV